jgi:hypothetical protein
MPHTKSRYQQDLPFTDGRLFASVGDMAYYSTAGTLSQLRVNPADYSIHAANTTTGFVAVNLTSLIIRRLGFFEDLQEQFGGAGIPGSAEYQGRPDTLGSMATGQPITPRTAFKIKGFQINSFDVVYTVSSANMTALTCRVDTIQYLNGVAVPAATSVLASGVNGLVTTFSANLNVVTVAIPAPYNSQFWNLADQVVTIELGLQTPGGGTFDIRGFDCALTYNFN